MAEELGLKAMQRKLTEAKESNKRREQELNAKGIGVTEVGILQMQVQAMRDVFLDTEELKAEWELAYQNKLAETLDLMDEQLRKHTLLQGMPGPSALVVPGGGAPAR